MTITVSTRMYEFDHGTRPRGRGSWAFYFGRRFAVEDAFWVHGPVLYREAKKQAIAEARRRGETSITVGS